MYSRLNIVTVVLAIGARSLGTVGASPGKVPTLTVVGWNQGDASLDMLPTSRPWSPAELIKRLNGDPAICGYVDGDPSGLTLRSQDSRRI